MKIIDVISARLLQVFPEISGQFTKILNFWKIYNPTYQLSDEAACTAFISLTISIVSQKMHAAI